MLLSLTSTAGQTSCILLADVILWINKASLALLDCVRTILTTFYHMNNYAATGHTLVKEGPMGGVLYIRPRLGDGSIFMVPVSHLDTKAYPSKLPTLSS